MTRHEARVAVFSLIFESFFRQDDSPEEIYSLAAAERGFSSNKYIRETYFGVMENAEILDGEIGEYANNWKVDRMSRTAKAILRLCAYELTFTDVPPKAAVNEAIEIAKEYAGEEEASFINGILNTFAKAKGFIEVNTDGAQPKDSCKTNE